MDPQQPYGSFPPAPPQGNPYDFITAPPSKPPRTTAVGGGGSFAGKLALVGGGAVVLVIIVVVLMNVIFGNKTNFANLIELAQTQQEIARVAQTGIQTVGDQALAGAGMNTRLTMITQQQNLVTYMSQHKQKVSSKQLSLKKSRTTDQRLSQAQATSTFDIVYAQVVRQELVDYAASVKTAWQGATGKNIKAILATDYNQTQMLLKQWPSQ
ncbi:MAG TPA: hypothetical protein VF466_03385 [Candidatus Saccharimonadales bacterium]